MAPPTHAGFNHGGYDFYVTFLPYPDADAVDEVKLSSPLQSHIESIATWVLHG